MYTRSSFSLYLSVDRNAVEAMEDLSTDKYARLVDRKAQLDQKRALNGQLEPVERTEYARLAKSIKQYQAATTLRQSLASTGPSSATTPTEMAQPTSAGNTHAGALGAPPGPNYSPHDNFRPPQPPVQPNPGQSMATMPVAWPATTPTHQNQLAYATMDNVAPPAGPAQQFAPPAASDDAHLASASQRKAYRRGVMEGMEYAHASAGAAAMDVDASQPAPVASSSSTPHAPLLRPGHLLGAAIGTGLILGGKYLYDRYVMTIHEDGTYEKTPVPQDALKDPKAMEDLAKKVEQDAKDKMDAIADEPAPEPEKMAAPQKNAIPIPPSVVPLPRTGKTYLSS